MPPQTTSQPALPLNLQIAFQGGGARLALLIPIVDALLELEADFEIENGKKKHKPKEINVTRVAGTSAGAIAAALLAGEANIPALVQYLRGLCVNDEGAALRKIFPSISSLDLWGKIGFAKRLLWDQKPIGDEKLLSRLIGDALEAAGIGRESMIEQFVRPCFLVSVTLGRRDRDPAPPKSKLVQALMDSAGLPFIFRLTGDRLDGGLLDNLPIDALKTPESPGSGHGEIIAIAFDEPNFVPQPGDALALAASLLDTTMTFKTRASRDSLSASNVYEIKTTIGGISVTSFDIQTFITFMKDENAYARVKAETLVWFRNFIKLKEQQRTQSVPPPQPHIGATRQRHRTESERRLEDFEANLRSIAEHNFRHPTLIVEETTFEVIAHGLKNPDDSDREPDIVRVIDRVRVGDQPLFLHAAVLFSSSTSVVISRDFKVFDSQQREVNFVAFDVPGETGAKTWHLTIFQNPLPPSHEKDETYTIQGTYEVRDFMRPLHQNGVDYLTQEFVQAAISKVAEIRLCVPQSLGPLELMQGTPEQFAELNLTVEVDALAARKIDLVEGKWEQSRVVAACPVKFDAYVWRAENCKRDHGMRVVYRKK